MCTPVVRVVLWIWFVLTSAGCSVGMAMSGTPQPDFEAFDVGSSRQIVEFHFGQPVSSVPRQDGSRTDTYRYEIGNSPNNARALMNLYLDIATLGLWEIPGTVIEATMGDTKETVIIYSHDGRVLAITGYTPPKPRKALSEAVAAQEEYHEAL